MYASKMFLLDRYLPALLIFESLACKNEWGEIMGERVGVSSKLMEVQNTHGRAAHEVKYLLLLIIFVRGIIIIVSLLLNK